MCNLEKKFPSYFDSFQMPVGAKEQSIQAFRACATGAVDKESFIPSFEEENYQLPVGMSKDDPSVYSLSVFELFKDIKRFMTMTSKYQKPFLIAIGTTETTCGPCQRTKERTKKRTSHIDWWLYMNAEPHMYFREYSVER